MSSIATVLTSSQPKPTNIYYDLAQTDEEQGQAIDTCFYVGFSLFRLDLRFRVCTPSTAEIVGVGAVAIPTMGGANAPSSATSTVPTVILSTSFSVVC